MEEEIKQEEKTAIKRKVKKNVYQKFFAFKHNYFEKSEKKKDVNALLEEQACFIYFSDEVFNAGSCEVEKVNENNSISKTTSPLNYFKSTIHFVDAETGNELTAVGVAREFRSGEQKKDDGTRYSREYAFKALLGVMSNHKDEKTSPENEVPQAKQAASNISAKPVTAPKTTVNKSGTVTSPTPARTPSEPKGGVPKGFTGFQKK